jgi:hypothetical protein
MIYHTYYPGDQSFDREHDFFLFELRHYVESTYDERGNTPRLVFHYDIHHGFATVTAKYYLYYDCDIIGVNTEIRSLNYHCNNHMEIGELVLVRRWTQINNILNASDSFEVIIDNYEMCLYMRIR